MKRGSSHRRGSLAAALLVSLAAHVAVLLAFAFAPKPSTVKPPKRPPLQLDLVYVSTKVPQKAPTEATVPPTPKKAPANATKPVAQQPRGDGAQKIVERSDAEADASIAPPDSGPSDDPTAAAGADAPFFVPEQSPPPTKLYFIPEWTVPLSNDGKASPRSRGRTIRNDGLGPSPEAVAQYEAEVLQRRLNRELQGEATRGRIRNGDIPGPMRGINDDMKDAVRGERQFLTHAQKTDPVKTSAVEAFDAWQQTAAQFGRTGSPVQSPEDTRAVEDSPFGRSSAQHLPHLGDIHDQAMTNGLLRSAASLQIMAKRNRGPTLRTLIELNQHPSGAVASARLLETSGNTDFDAFAMRVTLQSAERRHLDAGKGERWRSVWQFVFDPPRVKVDLLEALPVVQ